MPKKTKLTDLRLEIVKLNQIHTNIEYLLRDIDTPYLKDLLREGTGKTGEALAKITIKLKELGY